MVSGHLDGRACGQTISLGYVLLGLFFEVFVAWLYTLRSVKKSVRTGGLANDSSTAYTIFILHGEV